MLLLLLVMYYTISTRYQIILVAVSIIRFLNDKLYTVKYYPTVMEQKDLDDCLTVVFKNQDYTMSPCAGFIWDDLIEFCTNIELLQELKNKHLG